MTDTPMYLPGARPEIEIPEPLHATPEQKDRARKVLAGFAAGLGAGPDELSEVLTIVGVRP